MSCVGFSPVESEVGMEAAGLQRRVDVNLAVVTRFGERGARVWRSRVR